MKLKNRTQPRRMPKNNSMRKPEAGQVWMMPAGPAFSDKVYTVTGMRQSSLKGKPMMVDLQAWDIVHGTGQTGMTLDFFNKYMRRVDSATQRRADIANKKPSRRNAYPWPQKGKA